MWDDDERKGEGETQCRIIACSSPKAPRGPPDLTSPSERRIAISSIIYLLNIIQYILQAFRHFTYIIAHFPTLPSLYLRHSSFSNPSVASPTSQFILQPFFRFSYFTGSSLVTLRAAHDYQMSVNTHLLEEPETIDWNSGAP